jgi:hypothetical protein
LFEQEELKTLEINVQALSRPTMPPLFQVQAGISLVN